MTRERTLAIDVGERVGRVDAVVLDPPGARCLMTLAHGAGAGMGHPFMEGMARRLAGHGIGTLRFQFPYMQKGRRAPDRPAVLLRTIRAAVAAAGERAKGRPVVAAGKSLGGRMTSTAAAEGPLPGVRGIVFFGFPLHAPGAPSSHRGDHLSDVGVPMLFLQGDRDKLAELGLLRGVLRKLPGATIEVVAQGDHSFHVPKRSGRTDDDVLDWMGERVSAWIADLPGLRA